ACGDMASDVWNMVRTKGINAEIAIGNVDMDITSRKQCNHAWVMAELSGTWLALEATGGCVVYSTDNKRYYRGYFLANAGQLKQYLELIHRYDAIVEKDQRETREYNKLVGQYNQGNAYLQKKLKVELERKAVALDQRRADLMELDSKI